MSAGAVPGMSAPITNAADPQQQAHAKTRERLAAAQAADDWAAVLALPGGRRVLAGLVRSCGVLTTVFDRDPLVMAAQEGRRNVGLSILASMHKVSPEQAAQVLREATTDG